MRHGHLLFVFVLIACAISIAPQNLIAREFLTGQEIKKIQEAQEIDRRVRIYMEAAELRLETAQERLSGVESVEGDPLEFFTPEQMVDGYYQIVRSVMLNLEGAFEEPNRDLNKIKSGLKSLKKVTDKTRKRLETLKRIAEENSKEELWNLVSEAIDITEEANEGAVYGQEKIAEITDQDRRRRR